jgi:hypothetical protein
MNKKLIFNLILIVSVIGLLYYFPGCSTTDDVLTPTQPDQIFANGSLTPINRTTVSGNMFVTDQNGNPIQGLDNSNISARLRWDVLDVPDSVNGTVTVTTATNKNIAAANTMDYSGSMGTLQIQCMESAVHAYINGMSPTDIAEIIKFSSAVQVMQGFTSDTALLHQAVDAVFPGAGGLTALYQSIFQGLTDANLVDTSYLRTVVAFTDGAENNSTVARATMINQSFTSGIPIFTVTLTDFPTGTAALDMKNIADTTGGFPFVVDPDSCSQLNTIYQQINNQLNNAYSVIITWPSANLPPSGSDVTAVVYVTYNGLTASFQRTYQIP